MILFASPVTGHNVFGMYMLTVSLLSFNPGQSPFHNSKECIESLTQVMRKGLVCVLLFTLCHCAACCCLHN